MSQEDKVNELAMAFDLMDEIIPLCIKDTEEETRKAIKEEIRKRYEKATSELERNALISAQAKLDEFSFEELQEQAELLSDEDF